MADENSRKPEQKIKKTAKREKMNKGHNSLEERQNADGATGLSNN
jgi:hypothetical protein